MPAIMPFERVVHAEFGRGQLVGTAAVARLPVCRAIVIGRNDRQVIVGHQPWQIRIGRSQFESDRVVAIVDKIDHIRQQRLGSRGRFFAAVMVHRRNHVIRGDFCTAVECRVFVDLEGPFLGVRRRAPFAGDIRPKRSVGLDEGQVGAERMRNLDHREGHVGSGIMRVGCVAVMRAEPEISPL